MLNTRSEFKTEVTFFIIQDFDSFCQYLYEENSDLQIVTGNE